MEPKAGNVFLIHSYIGRAFADIHIPAEYPEHSRSCPSGRLYIPILFYLY